MHVSYKVQWLYRIKETYEEYPAEINSIIELAFRGKKTKAEWTEDDDKMYFVDFATMDEVMTDYPVSCKKVKRITSGKMSQESASLLGAKLLDVMFAWIS
jgi:prolyl oligopeptidase PreP (S9A serine peptidase family)